jgi:hypothetical protein
MKTTFTIQKGHTGREVLAIRLAADWLGAEVVTADEPVAGSVPIGTVEWCEPSFGVHRKDFYPEFLYKWRGREMRRFVGRPEFEYPVFMKDASAWKSGFVSRVVEPGERVPNKDWWLSERVDFRNEWRYYVADGSVVTTGWYQGEDEDEPAPKLAVEWPEGFSGAVDFGELACGDMALVECHAPFACGWYGDDHRDYALWQAVGWEKSDWWR